MKRDEWVLVSWVSFNGDPYLRDRRGHYSRDEQGQLVPGPALELLTNARSPYRGKITRAYFFVRSGPEKEAGGREIHPRELDVFAELQRELRERVPELVIEQLVWETAEPPTAYRPLLKFTADRLRRVRRAHPSATILVNLSPGTPQMHTTLLVALGARCAGDRIVAVQGAPREKRNHPAQIAEEVPWDLLSRLNIDESRPEAEASRPSWDLETARTPMLRELIAQVDEAARVPFPVLIQGGRGSGKTRVAERLRARYLAQRGRVGAGSWELRVNCAALHRELLLSELFGHVKGAFTGASKQKEGLLERARGDCVFLDEIHHLDHDAQAKLLVAIERRGEFRPLGSDRPKHSDFRLVSATNRPLSELRRNLLPDFWDRISDFVLRVPDLRDCPDDLDGMWRCAVQDACDDVAAVQAKSPQAVAANGTELFARFREEHHQAIAAVLRRHPLPGNWRDLQSLARRILARTLDDSSVLTGGRAALRPLLTKFEHDVETTAIGESVDAGPTGVWLEDMLPSLKDLEARIRGTKEMPIPIRELRDALEHRLLEAVVEVAGSGRAGAELAGIPARTLNGRLKELRGRNVERHR